MATEMARTKYFSEESTLKAECTEFREQPLPETYALRRARADLMDQCELSRASLLSERDALAKEA